MNPGLTDGSVNHHSHQGTKQRKYKTTKVRKCETAKQRKYETTRVQNNETMRVRKCKTTKQPKGDAKQRKGDAKQRNCGTTGLRNNERAIRNYERAMPNCESTRLRSNESAKLRNAKQRDFKQRNSESARLLYADNIKSAWSRKHNNNIAVISQQTRNVDAMLDDVV